MQCWGLPRAALEIVSPDVSIPLLLPPLGPIQSPTKLGSYFLALCDLIVTSKNVHVVHLPNNDDKKTMKRRLQTCAPIVDYYLCLLHA